jgi:hypothetical protein
MLRSTTCNPRARGLVCPRSGRSHCSPP